MDGFDMLFLGARCLSGREREVTHQGRSDAKRDRNPCFSLSDRDVDHHHYRPLIP
jgi:hypothetical protein